MDKVESVPSVVRALSILTSEAKRHRWFTPSVSLRLTPPVRGREVGRGFALAPEDSHF
jgi:hypothetical protein